MDANFFGMVKAELEKPPPLEGEEEEESADKAEDVESGKLRHPQKKFEDMQKNFELVMKKQKELLDQEREQLERVQDIQGTRNTTFPVMETNLDISSALQRDFII